MPLFPRGDQNCKSSTFCSCAHYFRRRLPYAYAAWCGNVRFFLFFFKYILLSMLLQFSRFPPFIPLCPAHPLPPSFPLFSSCPWVIHISSVASTFPILFLTSPCLFSMYHLCYLFSVPFPPPPHSPANNPSCDLHFCDSVPGLVVCLVCFCFCF